ncbi:ragB domain-containing protein, putative [Babesia ovata]|uniref:RagB domain-containing protein, putative n=1 Tax=Babesia ovata TaxID=189622 RepID=A0A2H6KAX2_9APIC|nr:ragB domain-containing protein, putative [Babesia ovata]GBE60138.1 ragB domain-containing protein, putative [Babesia ovata]
MSAIGYTCGYVSLTLRYASQPHLHDLPAFELRNGTPPFEPFALVCSCISVEVALGNVGFVERLVNHVTLRNCTYLFGEAYQWVHKRLQGEVVQINLALVLLQLGIHGRICFTDASGGLYDVVDHGHIVHEAAAHMVEFASEVTFVTHDTRNPQLAVE